MPGARFFFIASLLQLDLDLFTQVPSRGVLGSSHVVNSLKLECFHSSL
jgi:hypothetical protein